MKNEDENILVLGVIPPFFKVNLDNEESREGGREFLSDITQIPFKWFKEESGSKNWVLYDSRAFEVLERYGIRILHYIDGCGINPSMPLNGTSCMGMFAEVNLENVSLDKFVTSDVIVMSHMFENCKGVTSEIVRCFSTYNVILMDYMFAGSDCVDLDLSHFETDNLQFVANMCEGCELLEEIILTGWNFSKVVEFSYMFSGCTSLEYIACSEDWGIRGDASGEDVFRDCFSLPDFDEDAVDIKMATMSYDGGYISFI